MDSPFPGMDPYLESRWSGVHHRLITYAADQLQPGLPRGFRVEVEERVFVEGRIEAYLEILDTARGNRVVTAIEFLSPTNKTLGDGNDLYVRQQREYRAGGVSRVEIDLTREGDRGLVLPMSRIPPQHRALYLACVRRAWNPARIEAHPMPLEAPLKTIGVPLEESLDDVPLDLQALITQCYRNGRYDDLDYRADLPLALPSAEAAWADRLLRAAGKR